MIFLGNFPFELIPCPVELVREYHSLDTSLAEM
jgi:hypothetical protein